MIAGHKETIRLIPGPSSAGCDLTNTRLVLAITINFPTIHIFPIKAFQKSNSMAAQM
jgi:hypothetical protein